MSVVLCEGWGVAGFLRWRDAGRVLSVRSNVNLCSENINLRTFTVNLYAYKYIKFMFSERKFAFLRTLRPRGVRAPRVQGGRRNEDQVVPAGRPQKFGNATCDRPMGPG